MDNLVHLLILGLATFRLSNMMADASQGGPWDILSKLRYMAGLRYNEASEPYGSTMLARGMMCEFCNSVWFGILLAAMYIVMPEVTVFASLPFALSAFAILPILR